MKCLFHACLNVVILLIINKLHDIQPPKLGDINQQWIFWYKLRYEKISWHVIKSFTRLSL